MLQIISDIHLEFYKKLPQDIIRPSAKYLALLGDIGRPRMDNYQQFIKYCSENFTQVFIIAGNHEFYSSSHSYEETHDYLYKFANGFPNVHFLDNDSYMLEEGIKILGTTLWSNIPKDKKAIVESTINDYKCIRRKFQRPNDASSTRLVPITSGFINDLHNKSVGWLTSQLKRCTEENTPCIVLSHHCPIDSIESAGKYYGTDLNHAYCTDLTGLIKKPIIAWCYGHLHNNNTYKCGDVQMCNNHHGYRDENLTYQKDYVLKIEFTNGKLIKIIIN